MLELSWGFDKTLKVGFWDYLEQISTIAVIFVHATFCPATFVHIRNISSVTDLILTKLTQFLTELAN